MHRSTLRGAVIFTMLVLASVASSSSAAAQRRDPARIRWGIEGGAGGEWGTPRGASLGLYGQIGLQLNNTLALYYQPSLIAHALSDRGDETDTFGAFGNLGVLDVTIGALQLGIGGGFDLGRFTWCDLNFCYGGPRDIYPALGGRVAAVIGVPTLQGRFGVPIGLQIHSTFLDDTSRVTSLVLTIGVQRY